GLVAASGWASGLNVYAVVLVLGLLGRLTQNVIPEQLTSWLVLGVAAVMYVVEFFVDKVPYLDDIWDAVHTVIRPVAAGWVGYLLAGEVDLPPLLGADSSGVTALAASSTKAPCRAAVNVSPGPFSNIGLSLFEDGLVVGLVLLAVEYPLAALVVVVVLLVLGVWLVVTLWR